MKNQRIVGCFNFQHSRLAKLLEASIHRDEDEPTMQNAAMLVGQDPISR
jgi:hypothetical protein